MYALLKPEHRLVRQLAREFAENEVRPLAAELDEEERFPEETVPKPVSYTHLDVYKRQRQSLKSTVRIMELLQPIILLGSRRITPALLLSI